MTLLKLTRDSGINSNKSGTLEVARLSVRFSHPMTSSHNYLAFNRKGSDARLPCFFFQVPSIMDEKISDLFQEWLSAFGAVQVASGEEAIARAHSRLSEIETQIANTPGQGMECLAIKLGLYCFLSDHADAASLQSEIGLQGSSAPDWS